jgi:hypothetical protein
MAKGTVCAAGAAAVRAALPGERVSLIWERGPLAVTFNWTNADWFWAAYDSTSRRLMGTGRSPTIEDAVEQAWLKTKPAAAPAAE